MNHNDPESNFKRELELFERIIQRLTDQKYPFMFEQGSCQSEVKEGGNHENVRLKQRIPDLFFNAMRAADPFSQTASEDIHSQISLQDLQVSRARLQNQPDQSDKVCSWFGGCFTCFQRPDDRNESSVLHCNSNKRNCKQQQKKYHQNLVTEPAQKR
jgi:hypothetical protein